MHKMLCPNCNTENDDSANFCTNCRTPLNSNVTEPAQEATSEPTSTEPASEFSSEPAASEPASETPTESTPAEPVSTEPTFAEPASSDSTQSIAEPVSTAPTPDMGTVPAAATAPASSSSSETPNFFAVMVGGLLKPMTILKENLPKFDNIKNSAIFALIITVISTLLTLLTNIFGLVREESCTGGFLSEKKCEVKFEFDNLKDFDWFKSIGTNFLTTLAVIAVVAGIFFAISRAFKKTQTNYFKMVAIVSLAMVPMALAATLGGFISYMSALFGMAIIFLGAVYGFYIFYEGINNEVQLEGDKKIYFNIACVAITLVAYYIYLRIMFGEAADAMFSGGFSLTGGSSSSSDYSDYLKYLDF